MNKSSFEYNCINSNSSLSSNLSILFNTNITGVFIPLKSSIIFLSPGPIFFESSTTNNTKSTFLNASVADFTINSPNLFFGLCIPGVSKNTI